MIFKDDLRDIELDFPNITCIPVKWDDVLITRINSKICISGKRESAKIMEMTSPPDINHSNRAVTHDHH